jgi:Domain of unknown function (DUF4214)/Bacterial TSP3 repeat
MNDTPVTVAATASSTLAVSFTSDTGTICATGGTNGTSVTLLGVGVCTLRASQAGDSNYLPATPVTQSFTIAQARTTLTLSSETISPVYGSAVIVRANVTGRGTPSGSVNLSHLNVGVCTITLVGGSGSCNLPGLVGGNNTVSGIYSGDATNGASAAIVELVLGRANQTIDFAALPNRNLGDAPLNLSASANSALDVVFTSSTPSICAFDRPVFTPAGLRYSNRLTLLTTGTCVINATQAGNTNYNAAPAVVRSFTVNAAPLQSQAITFAAPATQTLPTSGTATVAINASSSSALPVSFASQSGAVCTVTTGATNGGSTVGTVTLIAAGTCTIRASQAGDATFAAASNVDRSFAVNVSTPPPVCNVAVDTDDCDNDGIPNGVERDLGTNPNMRDNDVFSDTERGRRLFVMQMYRDLLGREADAAGLDFWLAQLNANTQGRIAMVQSFLFSLEAENTEGQAARLYFAAFGRSPDAAGLKFWAGQVQSQGAAAVAQSLAENDDFRNRYGSLDNAGFIDRMYRNVIGRVADTAGLNFWVGQMAAPANLTRGQILLQFANSAEYRRMIDADVAVARLYIAMLRRQADNPSLAFWANLVKSGGSIQELINTFITSAEYRARFHP